MVGYLINSMDRIEGLPCVCGHSQLVHYDYDKDRILTCCGECYYHVNIEVSLHSFKLDNLTYIEQLAKEKNLV